jgi:thiol-disulfide isomerase/thioredoxin
LSTSWFAGCPPCVRTSPLLAELDRSYSAKGLRIVALNADRALELPTTDEDRAACAKKYGWVFTLAHMTPEAQEAYGAVSVFPTFFFVDRRGAHCRPARYRDGSEAAERSGFAGRASHGCMSFCQRKV